MSVLSVTSDLTDEDNNFNNFHEEPNEITVTRFSKSPGLSVYASYFSASGKLLKTLAFIFICLFTQVLVSGGDYWIIVW